VVSALLDPAGRLGIGGGAIAQPIPQGIQVCQDVRVDAGGLGFGGAQTGMVRGSARFLRLFAVLGRRYNLKEKLRPWAQQECGVNFSEQPPSKQWAALKYGGEIIAEVWFKPEGEPLALTLRIPLESFQLPEVGKRLTVENLLKAVGVASEQVESWRHEGVSPSGMGGSPPELRHPLPPPPQELTHLSVHVRLKPAPQVVTAEESGDPEILLKTWQDLQSRWNTIRGLEAAVDRLRVTVGGLEKEMQTLSQATLTPEEKLHGLKADLAQWNKAKGRARFGIPKAREFIHRATWALGDPDRKRLAELFKDDTRPDIALSHMTEIAEQLEHLLKQRQVLSAHGTTAQQECKRICDDIHRAYSTLKRNAAANADRKRRAAGSQGKFFKTVRRVSGAQ
jgi:hypothetical protein